MKHTITYLILLGIMLVSACSSTPEYLGPTEGPTAKIKFTTAGTRVGATLYEDENCSIPNWVSGTDAWVTVPAGKPLIIQRGFNGAPVFGVVRQYNSLASFVPEEGAYYEHQYIHGFPHSIILLLPLTPDGKYIPSDKPRAGGKAEDGTDYFPQILEMSQITTCGTLKSKNMGRIVK
jgi:hypothetical protein